MARSLTEPLMLVPDWEQACKNCSYMVDHTDGAIVHLAQRDVTFVAVSRAPLAEIERIRQRMAWKFAWVSRTTTALTGISASVSRPPR
jgi:predicted dithiol-disulfide oxidoreductase (DUF899 family)